MSEAIIEFPTTPNDEPSVFADRFTAVQLNARVLEAIRASSFDQFTTGLAWGQWCRSLAIAALDKDADAVAAMTSNSPAE